jgi:hypothetical protein
MDSTKDKSHAYVDVNFSNMFYLNNPTYDDLDAVTLQISIFESQHAIQLKHSEPYKLY